MKNPMTRTTTIKKMTTDRNYYCSRKFTELSLTFQSSSISSCCAASPYKIDFVDLEKNGLLNLSVIRNERKQMLSNTRVLSCEKPCWKNEDAGLPSIRSINGGAEKTHQSAQIDILEQVNISLGNRCTLTCSYCGPEWSRAWSEDIEKNGEYNFENSRPSYVLSTENLLFKKLKQNDIYSSSKFQTLYSHLIEHAKTIKVWYITGGETLLYETQVLDLIKISNPSSVFTVMTGLGIPKNKFIRLIDQLRDYPSFKLGISAENIGKLHEFNRYGYSFDHLVELLDYVKTSGIKYQFYSTLSNLTAFGYVDFVNFVNAEIEENLCVIPEFLDVQKMDKESKYNLLEVLDKQNNQQFKILIDLLKSDYEVSPIDQKNLATFLQEFSSRRNLDLSIFPKTFLDWLDIHVVQ